MRPVARSGRFFKEFIILFGFLNGVWLAVGVNPGERLYDVFVNAIARADPTGVAVPLLLLAPLAVLAFIIMLIHRKGGWLGIMAVITGFISGMFVLTVPVMSLTLLAVAFVLGYFATR